MNVLWLASWYPNKIIALDGDFIQRHAIAVSRFIPITVIYVTQYGEEVEIKEDKTDIFQNGNLTEIIIYFSFKKKGIGIVDKLRYNWKYYNTYKKAIKKYFSNNTIPSLIHVHVPMKAGVIAQWIKKKWNIPYIISEHSATYVKGADDAFDKRSLYFRTRVASIFRNATMVTSVSRHDGNILKRIFNLERVEVIRNVVDTNHFFFRQDIMAQKFRFVHISVMNYQKNVEGIFNACALLKDIHQNWEIELIGRTLSPEIEKRVDNLGLKSFVRTRDEISYLEVAESLQQASALVVFSRYENFPCVIIEALSCGLPVIATAVGGIPEAVNTSNGILVSSENETDLFNAMVHMLTQYNSFNRESIAIDAKNKYAYNIIGEQFFNLYKALV